MDPKITYLYIVRKNSAEADQYECWEDCVAEMPQKFLMGTIRGNLIDNMKNNLINIFKEVTKYQFTESSAVDENMMKEETDDNIEAESGNSLCNF